MLLSRSKVFTDVVGVLARDGMQVGDDFVGMKIIGTMDQLLDIVERHHVDTIAVCLEDRRAVLPVQMLLELKGMGVDIWDGHHLYEEESGRLPIDELKPSAIIFSTGFRRGLIIKTVKRSMDLLVSLIGLFIMLPVMAILGMLIKLDSTGPIFYRQVRVGLRAQPYMIWKFRSMFIDAEKGGARWTSERDPRISRIGWYLRKWRLDEIPQLLNVIKGEMSLVGPRPERPVFVQELRSVIPYYDIRHAVRPGITGWAQTQFRYGASAEDAHVKLQYDLYYVKNLSLALDCRILLDTIRVILCGHGAR
ncbi:putative Undecaprenyl-phosphate galactose phosphotransferase RfbP [Nitrospira sp. KM1]|nr:putative Undecaprenyl-phosphate galactose phosphotransferase RfbP [Nitrospira sp. KM1]